MSKWIIDPDHSVAAFSIRHMMIAKIRGQFNNLHGFIDINNEDITKSYAEVTIDINGITTGISKRDEHLSTSDFFDISRFPEMKFRSRKITPTGVNSAKVTGDFSLHGITREITFDTEYYGPVKSSLGGETTMGFSARTEINREDFGMVWNEPMERGGLMLGREVQITVDIEADLETK